MSVFYISHLLYDRECDWHVGEPDQILKKLLKDQIQASLLAFINTVYVSQPAKHTCIHHPTVS